MSVDHWRARLRAGRNHLWHDLDLSCQSIIGALACAPLDIGRFQRGQRGVSRSLARSPARPPMVRQPYPPPIVSVDHWRARLRAIVVKAGPPPLLCVSRSLARSPARPWPRSTLQSWPQVSVDHWRARLRACALFVPGIAASGVSVDHWRARLRAGNLGTNLSFAPSVSRSLARSPARRDVTSKMVPPG